MTHDPSTSAPSQEEDPSVLVSARRRKLGFLRDELGVEPYGGRVDELETLAVARDRFDENAEGDARPTSLVSGRVVQHRDIGKLVFLSLRDATGDLQVSISKAECPAEQFRLAKKLDYGDIIVAGGPVGQTKRGEICIWANRIEIHSKSLVPPPEKYHGLSDPELRYRRRYVDMYANPATIQTLQMRSKLISRIRRFMEDRAFLEVETPMLHPVPGGAAARPFTTHHNTLDMQLYMRIAPELYLKRLLVGGLPRVFEINRNFRNEGVDRSHNPEFTAMEVYEAFGDCWSMLELTESLLWDLACGVAEERRALGDEVEGAPDAPVLPFGELKIDYARPFVRVSYGELFEQACGFEMTDVSKVREKAQSLGLAKEATLDDWLVVNEVFEAVAEGLIDPQKPTFVTDYPSVISPLTRPNRSNPVLADRWDLFIGGMEIGPAYTELNDPDIQLAKFTEQLDGADEEEQAFRAMDEDFIEALRVGMPPAGGLGLGIDRIIMLLTNSSTIRDVIPFPLMRREAPAEG